MSLNFSADSDSLTVAPIEVIQPIHKTTSIFSPLLHMSLLLTGPALLLLAATLRSLKKLRPAAAQKYQRRNAAAKAIKRIKNTTSKKFKGDFHHEIATALREYAADKFAINATSSTPTEVMQQLVQNGISQQMAKEFTTLLEHHFNTGFSSGTSIITDINKDSDNGCRAIKKMEEEL